MPAPARTSALTEPVPDSTGELVVLGQRGNDRRVLGGLLVVFGAGWVVKQAELVDVSWPAILASVLVALGVGMVVTAGAAPRSKGLIVLGFVLTLILASTSSLADLEVGELSYRPLSPRAVESEYDTVAGDVTVDLTALRNLPVGEPVPIDASVMFGELTVVVPDDVEMRVHGNVGAGELTVMGRTLGDGLGVSETYRTRGYADPGRPAVDIDVNVLFGSIEVRRAR